MQPLGLRKDKCSARHQPLDAAQAPSGLATDAWSRESCSFPFGEGPGTNWHLLFLMVGYKTEVWPDVEAYAGNPLEGKARKPQIQSQPRVQ